MSLKELIASIDILEKWIIESEMDGKYDHTDPFAPIYQNLEELRSKIEGDYS